MSCKEVLTYFSNRDIRLLGTRNVEYDVITLEEYCKWYSPYIIYRDGTVAAVSAKEMPDHTPFVDHNIHPDTLRWLALSRTDAGIPTEVCPEALEMAAGRWAMDVNEMFLED